MTGIVALIVLVLDIIAIVDILKSSADTGNKALWLILIIVLPVIGMVLYFLLGKKK
ncbi:MAG: PLD nuclease N-terminal domain-containing protein [Candidatus Omnitrophica bacterium]|nr:PLD nuclease N-terminal domain-containing protein [Candidatus Omnitrophota bacterium]